MPVLPLKYRLIAQVPALSLKCSREEEVLVLDYREPGGDVLLERPNLSRRMSMRRYTRLTNAFSRQIENHTAMLAVYFMWYNFGRVHQPLRPTPAMEACVSDQAWTVEEIVALLAQSAK